MRNDYTDITVVLDRSGSMQSTREDTIGGFNRFIQDQQKVPGKCTLSLVQFDDHYEPCCVGKPIIEADFLSRFNYEPRGSTALLAAIGRTIEESGRRLAALLEHERPAKVLFVIITDGQENASYNCGWGRQWADRVLINRMIAHQKDTYKWEFVFIGANQDAIAEASSLGIGASKAMTYTANAMGTQSLYGSLSDKATMFRSAVGCSSFDFDDADRKAQADAQPK